MSRSLTKLIACVVLATSICHLSFRETLAQAADDARFLHVLMVFDTNDPTVGKSVEVDYNTMTFLLQNGVPAHRYRTTVLAGEYVTPENILAYYRKLEVDRNDSMLFYYAGHGAWDTKSHYLVMNGGKRVRRTDIRTAMEARKARLNVLLTDCCSTYTGKAAFHETIVADPNVYRDLFFRHQGTVDLTAARKGQVALGNELKGGYFTTGLARMFVHTSAADVDKNRDGIVTWDEASVAISASTQQAFEMMKPRGLAAVAKQTKQTPHVFGTLAKSVGRAIPSSRHRFGIRVAADTGGVRVTEVFVGSPAEWAGIGVGERLTGFAYTTDQFENRQFRVTSPTEFVNAVRSVPAKKTLHCYLQDPGTGKFRDLRLRLSH